jgi:hypothetical protein
MGGTGREFIRRRGLRCQKMVGRQSWTPGLQAARLSSSVTASGGVVYSGRKSAADSPHLLGVCSPLPRLGVTATGTAAGFGATGCRFVNFFYCWQQLGYFYQNYLTFS